VLYAMFNDSTLRFHSFFPSLWVVERYLPLVNGSEVLGYEALVLRAIHSAIIMSHKFSGSNPPSLPGQNHKKHFAVKNAFCDPSGLFCTTWSC